MSGIESHDLGCVVCACWVGSCWLVWHMFGAAMFQAMGFVADGFVSTAGQGVSVSQKPAVAPTPEAAADGPMPEEYQALLKPLQDMHEHLATMQLASVDRRKLKNGQKAMGVLTAKLSHRSISERVMTPLQSLSSGMCRTGVFMAWAA